MMKAYLLVIAIPPDGTLAIDLAIPIQRQVVHAVEGQEVGWFCCPNAVWCYNVAIQLQITSSDSVLLVCCFTYRCRMAVTWMVIGDLQGP